MSVSVTNEWRITTDLFSARRVHGVLSIHAQRLAHQKGLEPKRSQYADVMDDYNTSATALPNSCSGCAQGYTLHTSLVVQGVSGQKYYRHSSLINCLSREKAAVEYGQPCLLSQPPPLLLELRDKLGIELVLTKSKDTRLHVLECPARARLQFHRAPHWPSSAELVEVKSMRALECPEGQHCSPQGTALDEFSLDSSAKS